MFLETEGIYRPECRHELNEIKLIPAFNRIQFASVYGRLQSVYISRHR